MDKTRQKSRFLLAASAALCGCWLEVASAQLQGPEFQVNGYTHSHQRSPAVATSETGEFVVVWESFGQDGSSYGVFGRLFDVEGVPSSADFQVNTYTTGLQRFPVVAAIGSGTFVVAWTSPQEDGWNWGIYAQRFDASATPVGSEFHVNTYTANGQYSPAIASTADGGFVVAWESWGQEGPETGVFAQRFDVGGGPVGAEFQVNGQTTGYQDAPSVAADDSGNFMVVWESRLQNGSLSRILGRHYDATGAPLGDEFQVNSYTAPWQRAPAVAVDAAGSFAVVWESHQQGGPLSDVHARRFDSMGVPLADEFLVNRFTTSDQSSPTVVADPAGGFVATWSSFEQDGWDLGVFAQRFDTLGNRVGSEVQVSRFASASQGVPALSASNSGEFVVVWESRYQDGSSFGVFGQRLPSLAFADGFEAHSACAWSAVVGGGCP